MTSNSLICRLDALLVPIYVALTAAALASVGNEWLAALAAHGKTRTNIQRDDKYPAKSSSCALLFFRFIDSLVVPKRFFLHFYVVGWMALATCIGLSETHVYPTLVISLLAIHLTRRLLECLYVHAWRAQSRMHLAGYGLGLLHYVLLSLVFVDVGSCRKEDIGNRHHHQEMTTAIPPHLVAVAAVILNLWAQYQQHRHHVLLASLRPALLTATSTSSASYSGPPRQAWFQWVACPHYLAEILVYMSLVVLQPSTRSVALLLWVAVNLTVSARSSHAWYLQHVKGYKERKLFVIAPGMY